MQHYEKENAKEWQMDTGETIKQKPGDKAEGNGWTRVNSSRPTPRKRFEGSSSKAPTPHPPISRPLPAKPPAPAKGHGDPVGKQPYSRVDGASAGFATRGDERVGGARGGPKVTSRLSGQATSRFPTRVTLVRKEDNPAKTAFRRGKPHNGIFMLDKTCEKIEPDRIQMYSRLEEIGVRFESFIRPPQFLADRTLLLWGNEEQLSQTVAELKQWVASSDDDLRGPRETMNHKSKDERFGRVGESVNKKQAALDKKIREEARMHKYQKDPEDGKEFAFQGYFLWPADEIRPQDLLGPSCEAYDSIRTYNHSHIMFEPTLSAFQIVANKEAAVQNALQRIEGTMREYVARSGKIYSSHMVQLPKVSGAKKEIEMVPGPSNIGVLVKMPLFTGASLTGVEVQEYVREKKAIDSSNQKRIRHALRKVILRLPFYRGQVRMRVVFGTFALSTFRWPAGATTVPVFDFISNIDTTATKGALIRDLQSKVEAEQLLARCSNIDGPFESFSVLYQQNELEDFRPIYTGRFKFHFPSTGNVILEVEFSKVSGGQGIYEITRSQWTKDEVTEASIPLEINMIQLNGGSSWKLHATSENVLDDSRITPQMADFTGSVTYSPPPKGIRPEITGHKVFKISSKLRYESFEQKTAVQFCHRKHGNWIFEVARYDTFTGNIATAAGKTQWGASYWNAEWDNTLGANLSLGIGQAASWNPWLETFFPKNVRSSNSGRDAGFQDFLQDLKYITGMLDEMKGLDNDHVDDEGDQIDALFS